MKRTAIIDPLDTVFFRSARPFSAGENSVGQHSLFPPAPHTLVGAIRAQWAASQGWQGRGRWDDCQAGLLNALGGDDSELQGVAFSGPELVAQADTQLTRLYPSPAALLGKLHTDDGSVCHTAPQKLVRLKPAETAMETDIGSVRLPVADGADSDTIVGRKNLNGRFLTATGLKVFLQGGLPSDVEHWYGHARRSSLIHYETRVGNQIEQQTGRVIDGMLYSTRHIRLADDIRLLMEVTAAEGIPGTDKPAHIAIGGEGRAASIEYADEQQFDQAAHDPAFDVSDFASGRYLIYVRTPIALPTNQDSSRSVPRPGEPFGGLPGRVVCACLYPAERYGEWLQQRGQRPSKTHSVIPAGSVVFFESGQVESILALQADCCVGERTTWGYGRIAVGKW